jgi:hypothetical protein
VVPETITGSSPAEEAVSVDKNSYYGKCQEFFPNYPENPLFEKSRFSGPFRQKRLSYSEITLMLFRILPGAPGCNKVSENEKTSGNRHILP